MKKLFWIINKHIIKYLWRFLNVIVTKTRHLKYKNKAFKKMFLDDWGRTAIAYAEIVYAYVISAFSALMFASLTDVISVILKIVYVAIIVVILAIGDNHKFG